MAEHTLVESFTMKDQLTARWEKLNSDLSTVVREFELETGMTVRVLHRHPTRGLGDEAIIETGIAFGDVPAERAMLENALSQLEANGRTFFEFASVTHTLAEIAKAMGRGSPVRFNEIVTESGKTVA